MQQASPEGTAEHTRAPSTVSRAVAALATLTTSLNRFANDLILEASR
jgi:hypothetical protein